MATAFPWKPTDAATIFAGIAARIMNVQLNDVITEAGMWHGSSWHSKPSLPFAGNNSNDDDDQEMDVDEWIANVGRTGNALHLRNVGPSNDGEGAGDETLETEESWSPSEKLGEKVIISAMRPLGMKARTIKQWVKNKVNSKCAELRAIEGVSRQEMAAQIKKLKKDGSVAIAEIGKAAAIEMLPLFEKTACVPDSVKVRIFFFFRRSSNHSFPLHQACAMWIARHPNMTLGFTAKSRDLGVLGQLLTAMSSTLRCYGVASSQLLVILLQTVRDSNLIAFLLKRLPMHALIASGYGQGKSAAMEVLQAISSPLCIVPITGASDNGMVPIHADPQFPPGDNVVVYDEAPPSVTLPNKKIPANQQRQQKMFTSWLTSGKVRFNFFKKIVQSNDQPT
jgi:hypothetical protein